jgi:hypothetical protein
VTLTVKALRQLVFYSFLNCCKTKIEHAGIHTIFPQQWHVLRQRGDRAPDPRLQAITDLAAEIAVHQRHDRLISILGDCNEEVGVDPALMANICHSYKLLDVMDTLHPDDAEIPSYARSSNRLDYGFVSTDLAPYLEGAGLLHYHEFYPSDHRPIFYGLSRRLFGPIPPLSSQQFRYAHSNSKLVATFVTLAHRHVCDTGSFDRLSKLSDEASTPAALQTLANSIDRQITRALLSAEKNYKKPKREPCSEELHCASLHVKYWRVKCSAKANNYDASLTLAAILPLLPSCFALVDDGLRSDKQSLNAA